LIVRRRVPNATSGAFLSQPLDNGYPGRPQNPRKFFYPALQCFDELERDSESFERKASDTKTFLSGRNHRNSRETLRPRKRRLKDFRRRGRWFKSTSEVTRFRS